MNIVFEQDAQMPCITKRFYINNIRAHVVDFGSSDLVDCGQDVIENGCIIRNFEPMICTQRILDKYDITEDEYNQIAQMLKEKLTFRNCKTCLDIKML